MPKRYPRREPLERVTGRLILCPFEVCQELMGKWNRLVASGPVVRKCSLRPKLRKVRRGKKKHNRAEPSADDDAVLAPPQWCCGAADDLAWVPSGLQTSGLSGQAAYGMAYRAFLHCSPHVQFRL